MVVVVPLQPQRLHVVSHVDPGPLHPQLQPGSVLHALKVVSNTSAVSQFET